MGIWNLLDEATRVAEDLPVGSIIKAGKQFIEGEGDEGAFTLAKGFFKTTVIRPLLNDDDDDAND